MINKLGEDTIGPGLVEDLQRFYEKTDSMADRSKCLELIDKVRSGTPGPGAMAKRPYTAIPAHGLDHSQNFLSPYQTSYNRDYPLKKPLETTAIRPMTSQGFSPPIGRHPDTHYHEEFMAKAYSRPMTPLRPGSASGNRANNPHPSQAFLVWKFPRGGPKETEGSKWAEEVTDDKINQVHKRLCQSTYQTDYLGVPQGFQLRSAYTLPPDWKENIPFTLDSVKRYSYQNHPQPEALHLPSTRYGSNKKKQIPASGTIPTASNRHMHIRNRTTYDRHYNDNSDAVKEQVRELGQKLGAEALRKYYETSQGDERTLARRLLEAYSGRPVTTTPYGTPQPPPQPPAYARPPTGRQSARVSNRSTTPSSTPVSAPYVPEPSPKNPNSRMSFNVYSPPNLLN